MAVLICLSTSWALATNRQPQDCEYDHVCYKEVQGAICGDGSPTGFSVTYRKNSPNLFIRLKGGGACWDKATCSNGSVKHLSAYPQYEGPYYDQRGTDVSGWLDIRSPHSPIQEGFNIVQVPYCTGDIHTGNKTNNYGTEEEPFIVHHAGYKNTELIFAELKKRFPTPDKVILYGTSAGGLGATWNLHLAKQYYPTSDVYIVNDGGLLFKPPYVSRDKVLDIYEVWGAESTSPIFRDKDYNIGDVDDLYAALVRYNQFRYPDVPYAYVQGYKDLIMTFFCRMLFAPTFTTAVKQTMISIANEEFARVNNYKAFYVDDWWHVFFSKDPSTIESEGVTYSDWAKAMFNQTSSWDNIRPDLEWDR